MLVRAEKQVLVISVGVESCPWFLFEGRIAWPLSEVSPVTNEPTVRACPTEKG